MGLSRNKVAVSEGAAGSPPFYGDTDTFSRVYRIVSRLNVMSKRSTVKAECFDLSCSIFSDREDHFPIRGCSSVGRAPALQAGGHGFESHHLHQKFPKEISLIHFSLFTIHLVRMKKQKARETRYIEKLNGLIAQVVRARA